METTILCVPVGLWGAGPLKRETAGGFYGSDARLEHITAFLNTQIISQEDPNMENPPVFYYRHLLIGQI